MMFVFSYWYIVLAGLILALGGTITAFVLMEKKDKKMIKEFLDKNTDEESK